MLESVQHDTLVKSEGVYSLGSLSVMPLNQDAAAYAYLTMKGEGTLENFFSQGVPDLATFLATCFASGGLSLGGFIQENGVTTLAGIGLMPRPISCCNGVVERSEVSEAFLRKYQRRSITLPLSKVMLEMVFDKSNVTVIYGTTPGPNRAAVAFMKAMGFEHLPDVIPHYGTWRGQECGVYVSWLTRSRWKGLGWFA
jgi:RimJ/RimL family protein N-acetyltransferase